MNQRTSSILIVILILMIFLSLSYTAICISNGIQDSFRIIIERDALKTLGVGDSYVVAAATLTIPGIGIFEPYKVVNNNNGIMIDFRDYSKFTNKIIKYYNGDFGKKGYIPTAYILLKDYDNDKSYYITISSYTVNLIKYAKENQNQITSDDLARVVELTKKDKLALLENKEIKITSANMRILVYSNLAGTHKLHHINTTILEKNNIIDPINIKGLDNKLKEQYLEEYPYQGTHIFQEVNWTKYYEYTQSIPKWWINSYVEGDGGNIDNYVDEYHRFVRDLMVSKYYAEKSYYHDLNQLIEALRDYIVEGQPTAENEPVNMVSLEEYVGNDYWNNSKEYIVDFKDIPLFRYYIDNHLSENDANKLALLFIAHYVNVNGAISGLMYNGYILSESSNINIDSVYYEKEISLADDSNRTGTLWLRDVAITYGMDYIFIDWIIDSTSSNTYYIITPVVTVTPIYSVSYDANSFDFETSTDTVPFYEDWSGAMSSSEESHVVYHKTTDSPQKIWELLVDIDSSSSSMNYDAIIDSPPFVGIVLDMLADETSNPAVKALASVYSLLSSVGYINVDVSADMLLVHSKLILWDSLSGESDVTIHLYYSNARAISTDTSYANLVFITTTYHTTSPPCGGSYCATTTTNSSITP